MGGGGNGGVSSSSGGTGDGSGPRGLPAKAHEAIEPGEGEPLIAMLAVAVELLVQSARRAKRCKARCVEVANLLQPLLTHASEAAALLGALRRESRRQASEELQTVGTTTSSVGGMGVGSLGAGVAGASSMASQWRWSNGHIATQL